jgi:hypothetical protein
LIRIRKSGFYLIAFLIALFLTRTEFGYAEELTAEQVKVNKDLEVMVSEGHSIQLFEGTELFGYKVNSDTYNVNVGEVTLEIPMKDLDIVVDSNLEVFVETDLLDLTKVPSDSILVDAEGNERVKIINDIEVHKNAKDEIILGNHSFKLVEQEIDSSNAGKNVEETEETEEMEETQQTQEATESPVSNEISDNKPLEIASLYDSDFIEVTQNNVSLSINENGALKRIGYVTKGEVYKKVREVGNWYQVKVGNQDAFIWKDAAKPSTNQGLSLLDNLGSSQMRLTQNVSLYDNSSGKLVKIGELVAGQSINYVDRVGNWFKVSFLGREAYIYESAVKVQFDETDKYYKVNENQVSIVVNNNGKLINIGKLTKGQVFKRVGNAGNWHVVSVAGKKAFVWKEATVPVTGSKFMNGSTDNQKNRFELVLDVTVYDNSSGSLTPIAKLTKGSSYSYVGRMGNWYKVIVSGREGYIHKDGVKLEFTAKDKYFEVSTDNLAVHKNVNGELVQIGTLKKGQVFKRVSDQENWHYFKFGSTDAYVWKGATIPWREGLSKDKMGQKSTRVEFVATEDLSVYDNSTGKLMLIGKMSKGTASPVVARMGNWLEINFVGRKAFVYSPATKINVKRIVRPIQEYTYEEMVNDLRTLALMYPETTELKTIGKSVDGRDLYAMKLGKGNREILVDASHHAREHITTNLVMSMLDEYAYAYEKGEHFYGMNVPEILNKTSIWFVPMVNPDGVTLVQKGHKSAKNPAEVLRINNFSTDFSSWKANIRGVDLNRQYPADWENILFNTGKPSPKNYKGTRPFTEPEAIAMYNFVKQHNFKASATYHSSGEIIYWYFNQTKNYTRDMALAAKIGHITGYSLVRPVYTPSAAFQDWFIKQEGFPSFTIEVSPYVVEGEVPLRNFTRIWDQNKTIGLVIAKAARNY